MLADPVVTVVIPFYDPPLDFFAEAIDSVFAQTYRSWELMLVDDGTSNGASDVARQRAAEYPDRVLYLQHDGHDNRGASAARNLGMQRGRGRYVAHLDADDVWMPDKLKEQVALLEQNPGAAMLYGRTVYWTSWSNTMAQTGTVDEVPEHGVTSDVVHGPSHLLVGYLRGTVAVPCTCSLLVRRDTALAVGGFEERFGGLYDDQAFYAKVCLTNSVYVSSQVWDKYRQHDDSMCHRSSWQAMEEARAGFLTWLDGYLQDQKQLDGDVSKAVRRERWLLRRTWLGHISPRLDRLRRAVERRLLALTG